MDAVEVECAEVLVSLSETVKMNLDEVNEKDCTEALCSFSKSVETEENPSFFQSSSTGGQMFDSPDIVEKTVRSKSDSKIIGGFTCCVPGCASNNKRNPELSFYNFPNGKSQESKNLRKAWIHLVSRKNFSPTSGHRVCSKHFPGGKKHYMNRLPTIVPKTIRPTPTKPRSTTKARNRTPMSTLPLRETNRTKRRLFSEATHASVSEDSSTVMYHTNVENIDSNQTEVFSELAERETNANTLENTLLNEQIKDLSTENKSLKSENKRQKTEIIQLKEQLQNELNKKPFSVDCFKGDDKLFRFYTGLQDYKTFKTLFASFGPAVSNLIYYGTKTKTDNIKSSDYTKHGPKRSLTPEEFFLVLVRLRLGLLEEDLAFRACISQSNLSRIIITWLDFLHAKLRSLPITMPSVFKQIYPMTRVIIDCTEIFVEMASSFRSQSATYSSYKSHNTAKGLIGISPAGAVTFVSDLYAGRSSDKQITKDGGILDLLEEGDSIMADKGFEIADDLPKGVTLNIPLFLRGNDHLSIEEETETRRIASVRFHVERAISRIKTFRILSTVYPIKLAPDLNKVWVICSYLTNVLPPLINDTE